MRHQSHQSHQSPTFVSLSRDFIARFSPPLLLPFSSPPPSPLPYLSAQGAFSSRRRRPLHSVVHYFSFSPSPLALATPPFSAVIKQQFVVGKLAFNSTPKYGSTARHTRHPTDSWLSSQPSWHVHLRPHPRRVPVPTPHPLPSPGGQFLRTLRGRAH